MGLTMKEKQAVTRQMALEYKRATKAQKGEILDALIQLTGYTRSYAARVLRDRARYVVVGQAVVDGAQVTLIEDERTRPKKKRKRKRKKIYDKDVLRALQTVWLICGGICGKRLAPYMRKIVCKLERMGELKLDHKTRSKLLSISAATIDRMLASTRKRYLLRARSQTKPGTLLKHQIPIRTFADWNELRPGFLEIDLVSHEGGNARGDYAYTLDATDVCTGWTETEAVRNRSQHFVLAGLEAAMARFPFEVLGIDSDYVLTTKSSFPWKQREHRRLRLCNEAHPCTSQPVPLWSSTCCVIPSYHNDTGSASSRPLLYFKQTGFPVEGPSIIYEVLTASTARLRGIDPLGTAVS